MKYLLLNRMPGWRWIQLILLTLVVTICGCIPVCTIYWEPAAQEGKIRNSVPGAVGFKDMIELSFNDVKIQLMGAKPGLVIDLLIPEGKSASFVADELELYEDQVSPRMIKFKMFNWDPKTLKPYDISPKDVMHGKNINIALFGGPQPMIYISNVYFGGKEMRHYFVKLPPLKVGEQVYKIPIVEFTRKEGFGVGPVN